MLEKKETKFFDPSLDELLQKIRLRKKEEKTLPFESLQNNVSEEDIKKLGVVLEKANEDEKEELINKADPNNNYDVFIRQYKLWARDNKNSKPKAATIASKVCFWLGSTFVQKPELVNMPDHIWYLTKDRIVCFPDQFKRTDSTPVSQFILFTNKYIEERRKKLLRNIAVFFLVLGMGLSITTYGINKIHQGYNYVTSYVTGKVNSYKQDEKNKEYQKQNLINEANSLVKLYKDNKISSSEFEKRKAELIQKQKELQ